MEVIWSPRAKDASDTFKPLYLGRYSRELANLGIRKLANCNCVVDSND